MGLQTQVATILALPRVPPLLWDVEALGTRSRQPTMHTPRAAGVLATWHAARRRRRHQWLQGLLQQVSSSEDRPRRATTQGKRRTRTPANAIPINLRLHGAAPPIGLQALPTMTPASKASTADSPEVQICKIKHKTDQQERGRVQLGQDNCCCSSTWTATRRTPTLCNA